MELKEKEKTKLENNIIKGNPNVVKPIGEYKTEFFSLIAVEHGFDIEGNYIWHFSSKTDRRQLSSDNKYLGEVVYTFLHKHIPGDCQMEVFFPNKSYDIRVLTVKGHGLGKKWNFDEKKANSALPKICEMLSQKMDTPRAWSKLFNRK